MLLEINFLLTLWFWALCFCSSQRLHCVTSFCSLYERKQWIFMLKKTRDWGGGFWKLKKKIVGFLCLCHIFGLFFGKRRSGFLSVQNSLKFCVVFKVSVTATNNRDFFEEVKKKNKKTKNHLGLHQEASSYWSSVHTNPRIFWLKNSVLLNRLHLISLSPRSLSRRTLQSRKSLTFFWNPEKNQNKPSLSSLLPLFAVYISFELLLVWGLGKWPWLWLTTGRAAVGAA